MLGIFEGISEGDTERKAVGTTGKLVSKAVGSTVGKSVETIVGILAGKTVVQ